jgi:hypothetical protein
MVSALGKLSEGCLPLLTSPEYRSLSPGAPQKRVNFYRNVSFTNIATLRLRFPLNLLVAESPHFANV